MEEITNAGISGDDNGEKREGHEVNDMDQKNETAEMKMEESDAEGVGQENETGEKKVEETDLSNDVEEMSPIFSLSWEDIMFR